MLNDSNDDQNDGAFMLNGCVNDQNGCACVRTRHAVNLHMPCPYGTHVLRRLILKF